MLSGGRMGVVRSRKGFSLVFSIMIDSFYSTDQGSNVKVAPSPNYIYYSNYVFGSDQ